MAWDFVCLRIEKYKYARGLLAVESNRWSVREWKREKKKVGDDKKQRKREEKTYLKEEKKHKSFQKVSTYLFKNLSLSSGTKN